MINTLRIYRELSETMDALAAEKIAEVIGMVYEELRNTVTKTEFNELQEVVADLAEAQKRTELRVEELAQAQKASERRLTRVELAVERLAQAQERTEMSLDRLAKQVGGLSDAVGGDIEDMAYLVFSYGLVSGNKHGLPEGSSDPHQVWRRKR